MGSILNTLKGAMETVKKSKPVEGVEEVGSAIKAGGKAALKKGKEVGEDIKFMYDTVTKPSSEPKIPSSKAFKDNAKEQTKPQASGLR